MAHIKIEGVPRGTTREQRNEKTKKELERSGYDRAQLDAYERDASAWKFSDAVAEVLRQGARASSPQQLSAGIKATEQKQLKAKTKAERDYWKQVVALLWQIRDEK